MKKEIGYYSNLIEFITMMFLGTAQILILLKNVNLIYEEVVENNNMYFIYRQSTQTVINISGDIIRSHLHAHNVK